MPVFEYQCLSCRKDFELLHLAGREVKKACPDCGSVRVEERVSVFSAGSSRGGGSPSDDGGMCGRCGDAPGSCGRGDA